MEGSGAEILLSLSQGNSVAGKRIPAPGMRWSRVQREERGETGSLEFKEGHEEKRARCLEMPQEGWKWVKRMQAGEQSDC